MQLEGHSQLRFYVYNGREGGLMARSKSPAGVTLDHVN